jgi:hypothetical protein
LYCVVCCVLCVDCCILFFDLLILIFEKAYSKKAINAKVEHFGRIQWPHSPTSGHPGQRVVRLVAGYCEATVCNANDSRRR